MTRLLRALAAAVIGLLLGMPSAASAAGTVPHAQMSIYTYDNLHGVGAPTHATTERGPPAAACDYTAAPSACDHGPRGASVRPQRSSAWAHTSYDHAAWLVQSGSLIGTTRTAPGGRVAEVCAIPGASVAAKAGDEAFHYTSSKWIESITTNGLNKGAYATPNGSLSPLQASLELALPPNRALPDAALRIDLAGLRKAGYEIPTPTRVSSTVSSGGRTYSMPGGGYEMQFPYAIPPEFIKVVPR